MGSQSVSTRLASGVERVSRNVGLRIAVVLTTTVALPIASLSAFKERFIVELSYVLSRIVTSVPTGAKLVPKAGSTRAIAPNETAANSFRMRVTLQEG